MKLETVEIKIPKFIRQHFLQFDEHLISTIASLENIQLSITVKYEHQLQFRTVMIVYHDPLHRTAVFFAKCHSQTPSDMSFEIFKLKQQQISCQKSDVFTVFTKSSRNYFSKINQTDFINRIEIIISIVSDLAEHGTTQSHYTSHLLIIKITHRLSHRHLLTVELIFPICLFTFCVKFVHRIVNVHNERMRVPPHKEALMFLEIAALETVVFANLSERQRKSNYLIIDR
jgi:hypothetical protein